MKKITEIGETLQHDNKAYVAAKAIVQERCTGCDFLYNNGEHNECHGPNELYCGGRIFKNVTLEYEQDSCFDHDFDKVGIKTILFVFGLITAICLSSLLYALYIIIIYFINLF